MRQLPARQLQRQFYKEVKDLPVAVTSRGDKQFIIAPHSDELEKFIDEHLVKVQAGAVVRIDEQSGYSQQEKTAFYSELSKLEKQAADGNKPKGFFNKLFKK